MIGLYKLSQTFKNEMNYSYAIDINNGIQFDGKSTFMVISLKFSLLMLRP